MSVQTNQMSATTLEGLKVSLKVRTRERNIDTKVFFRHCVCDALIFDPENSQIVSIFLCENAIEYVFSDKPNVGDHCGGFESKVESKEEREKDRH